MTARDKDPKRVGHITPAGMSVLDDLDLDPEFVIAAKRRIAELVAAQRQEPTYTVEDSLAVIFASKGLKLDPGTKVRSEVVAPRPLEDDA